MSKAFMWVNGVPFPPPKPGFKYKTITVVDAGRNANAATAGSRVGRDQTKLDNLEWPHLTAEQWEQMLGEFKKFKVRVKYYEPSLGRYVTRLMYPGDREATVWKLDENMRPSEYIDCKCNLIDMGYGE